MQQSIAELRRTADRSNPTVVRMLAAIDAVAALVGDNHALILGALHGAFITLACATKHPDKVIDLALEGLKKARVDL